ncbi:MAG TPA: hypothetical protein VGV69_03595 [Solirubrobacterales bacterium]|nr:hypothetical protein [Solirubrobacterales bacterium]
MEPRPLQPEETAVIRVLLDHADFDGRAELLAQVPTAKVVGRCGCGCATVELAVDRAPADDAVPRPIPNQATIFDEVGDPIGGVLLFAKDGCLAELEVYSFGKEPIATLPRPERLMLEVES